MKVRDIYLNTLGVYLPPVVSAEDAVADGRYDPADFAENGLTGTLVADEISPPEMAVLAARQAFARGGLDPARIDVVMHSGVFPQGPEVWSSAAYIQRKVIFSGVPAFEVRLGCNGLFAALELATCYLRAAPQRTAALLTAAETANSPLIDRWRSCPGFIGGDAGCALVLSKEPGFARLLSVASVTVPELEGLHRGGEPLFPPGATSGKRVDMRARSAYFRANEMGLADAWAKAAKENTNLMHRVLSEADIELSDVAKLAYTNTAGYMMRQHVLEPLSLEIVRTTWDFGRGIGHTGASDQFLALDHLIRTRQLAAGDYVLMAGIAPGLSLSSAVIEILDPPTWTDSGEKGWQ